MRYSCKQTSTRLTVNLSAIRENHADLSRRVGKAECAAVVKADAYGLGMKEVASSLAGRVQTFFVAQPEEGRQLRSFLPDKRIFVLHGFLPGQSEFMIRHGLIPVLNSLQQVREWRSFCQREGRNYPAALQFDTGMSRFGISFDEMHDDAVIGLKPVLVLSHLACADISSDCANQEQLRRFLEMSSVFPGVPRSLAASSGIFLGESYHFEMVRPGIALYGLAPGKEEGQLRPAVTLDARILQIRHLKQGDRIGYGLTYRAKRPMCVATVGIGYADGIFRSFSKSGALWIKGRRLSVLGRISMDSLSVDLTDIPAGSLKEGDWVSVIGDDQPLDQMAKSVGTIGYEILTSLGDRFDRLYQD